LDSKSLREVIHCTNIERRAASRRFGYFRLFYFVSVGHSCRIRIITGTLEHPLSLPLVPPCRPLLGSSLWEVQSYCPLLLSGDFVVMLKSTLLYLSHSNINSPLAGFSFQLFGQTLFTLYRKRPVNKPMVILSVMFFLVSTSVSSHSQRQTIVIADHSFPCRQSRIQHAMLNLYRLYQGMVIFPETTGLSPRVFFENNGTKLFVARSAVYLVATLLGDAVVVHEVSLEFCSILWF
jgi:hypothetical protein